MKQSTVIRWALCGALALSACDDEASSTTPDAAGDMAVTDSGADAGVEIGPCGDTPETVRGCADVTRYGASLELVAQPRLPGSPHWQTVQDECASVFEAAGFDVERHAYGTGVNVIGVKPGVDRPDERVLLSAHYDHLGECAGADDNATGVAAVLEAARVLGQANFARTIVLACWDEEEFGKGGSNSYAARAQAAGETIEAHFVFEMLGYRDATPNSQFLPLGFDVFFADAAAQVEARMHAGDFMAMITHESHVANGPLIRAAEAVGLPLVPVVLPDELRLDPSFSALRRSDHDGFWANDLPALMLTDTANFRNPNYHCSRGHDDIAQVDMDFAFLSVQATIQAAAELAEVVIRAGATAQTLTPPETPAPTPPVCDPIAQDCPEGARCNMVFDNGWTERCLPQPAAPGALDAICTRNADLAGDDSCAPGSLCAFWGLPRSEPQERRCRALCQQDADCADGENCLRMGGATNTGGCTPTCDPVGDDCPAGMRCLVLPHVERTRRATFCAIGGAEATGAPCESDGDCARGSCAAGSGIEAQVCRDYCLADADCGEGLTCFPMLPQAGLAAGTGLCLPAR
jgi:hypothetical protein